MNREYDAVGRFLNIWVARCECDIVFRDTRVNDLKMLSKWKNLLRLWSYRVKLVDQTFLP